MEREDFFPKVGETYRDRNGNKREVIYVAKSHTGTGNNCVAAKNLSNHTVDTYTINGTYFNNGEDCRDLMPPEPQYRKYTIDEAKELVGTKVIDKAYKLRQLIISCGSQSVWLGANTASTAFETLLADYIHTDGSPCGVEIK